MLAIVEGRRLSFAFMLLVAPVAQTPVERDARDDSLWAGIL